MWQGHCKVWQRHYFVVLFIPSPEICHGIKHDLTHQTNDLATQKNDLATINVARPFLGVARSFKSVAMSLIWVLLRPSPEICHGIKNDLTHQNNVFATPKNDLATKNVARSYFKVARSF